MQDPTFSVVQCEHAADGQSGSPWCAERNGQSRLRQSLWVSLLAVFAGASQLAAQLNDPPLPFSSESPANQVDQETRQIEDDALSKPARDEAEERFGTIKIGTPRYRVRELLGRPAFESVIPSLRRLRECYADDTEVTFVEGRVISVVPGERTHCSPDGTYFIELEKKTVAVAASALRQCGELIPDEAYKCAIETDFWFAPSVFVPTAYDGLRFTPPLAHGPYVRAYLLQFGAPHFFWPQKYGFDWCVTCGHWHPYSAAADTYIPPRGSGYYSFGAPY